METAVGERSACRHEILEKEWMTFAGWRGSRKVRFVSERKVCDSPARRALALERIENRGSDSEEAELGTILDGRADRRQRESGYATCGLGIGRFPPVWGNFPRSGGEARESSRTGTDVGLGRIELADSHGSERVLATVVVSGLRARVRFALLRAPEIRSR